MNKKIVSLILGSLLVLLVSCASAPKYVVAGSVDIQKYKAGVILNVLDNRSYPELMELDVKLFNALSESGIKMIGEKEIDSLSDEEKDGLFYVKYSAVRSSEEADVTLTLIDYKTLRPVASCTGTYSTMGSKADINRALDKTIAQLNLMWSDDLKLKKAQEEAEETAVYTVESQAQEEAPAPAPAETEPEAPAEAPKQ